MTAGEIVRAPRKMLPLRLDDVAFAVGARQIIRGVTTTIEAGSRTGLVAPDGTPISSTAPSATGVGRCRAVATR